MKYIMEVLRFKQSGKYDHTVYFNTDEEYMWKVFDVFKEGIVLYDGYEHYDYVMTGRTEGGSDHPNGYPCLIKGSEL